VEMAAKNSGFRGELSSHEFRLLQTPLLLQRWW
jgi:hypothetical protein